jgi:hypothetical protein
MLKRTLAAAVIAPDLAGACPHPAGAGTSDFIGAWTGAWSTRGKVPGGSVGLVVTETDRPRQVLGQFTFIRGATAPAGRYYGTVTGRTATFVLPGEGRIVLRADRNSLTGEFSGGATVLPASGGSLKLSRTD